jgi:hypothetical protein
MSSAGKEESCVEGRTVMLLQYKAKVMRTKNLAKNEFMTREIKKGAAHPTVTRPDEKFGGSVTKKPRRTYHCRYIRGILQGPGSFEVTPCFILRGDRAVGRRRLSWSP